MAHLVLVRNRPAQLDILILQRIDQPCALIQLRLERLDPVQIRHRQLVVVNHLQIKQIDHIITHTTYGRATARLWHTGTGLSITSSFSLRDASLLSSVSAWAWQGSRDRIGDPSLPSSGGLNHYWTTRCHLRLVKLRRRHVEGALELVLAIRKALRLRLRLSRDLLQLGLELVDARL